MTGVQTCALPISAPEGLCVGIDISDEMIRRARSLSAGCPNAEFIAGSFAQCRIFSKYLALQIKASEAGIIA